MNVQILVIIPARGGSKGIPRKNLRALAGRPLIAYAIETALGSRHSPDVYVSSEDDEIQNLASKLGANIHVRPSGLSADTTTLDQVVAHAYRDISASVGHSFDIVVTLQPTSPLLSSASLDEAIDTFLKRPDLMTVLSATDDTHLRWGRSGEGFEPRYAQRVNRQYLEPAYRETGGLIACRGSILATGTRIGQPVALLIVSGAEAIDIDTREDWALCEWYLTHRDIVFVVAGYPAIGLGHVHNALTIANELVRHRVRFVVTMPSDLAYEIISGHHYEVHQQRTDELVDEVLALKPDVIINDRLDTPMDDIIRLKEAGCVVINFEDLGPGARHADLVVNAIYPEVESLPNHYFGPEYFCLRREFVLTAPRRVRERVSRVLVTFGGVDPNNLTRLALAAISAECQQRGIEIEVIAGRGYAAFESLSGFAGIAVHRAVVDMADRIRAADVVITSGGRTVFEVASLGTPAIVLAQNDRELTHFYASEEHGFLNLGLGRDVSPDRLLSSFQQLLDSADVRRDMQRRMLSTYLRAGTARVVRLIEGTMDRHDAR